MKRTEHMEQLLAEAKKIFPEVDRLFRIAQEKMKAGEVQTALNAERTAMLHLQRAYQKVLDASMDGEGICQNREKFEDYLEEVRKELAKFVKS